MNEVISTYYEIVQVSENNYNSIKFLYKETFKLKSTDEQIALKYNTEHTGLKNIGFIAYYKQFPAAYYGVFPTYAYVNGKRVLAAQSGDTMTHQNHQKKGLFVKLAEKTYDLAKNKGVQFVFGFPNQNSYPGFAKKLNWSFYDKMVEFRISGSYIPFCEVAHKFQFIAPFYLKYIKLKLKNNIISNGDDLIFKFQHKYGIYKDFEYWKYKKRDNIFMINYDGFTLIIKVDNHILIGDVLPFDSSETLKFINTLKQLSKILKCKTVIVTVSKNHWLYKLLNHYLSAKETLPIGFLNLNNNNDIPFEKMVFSMLDYDTF